MFTRASKLPVPKNNTQTVVEKHVRSENSEKRSRTWHCAWLADANAEWKHGDKSKKDREIKTGRERERERESEETEPLKMSSRVGAAADRSWEIQTFSLSPTPYIMHTVRQVCRRGLPQSLRTSYATT
jgi:hypothetical protein